MSKQMNLNGFLRELRDTPTDNFHFAARSSEPDKNPEVLLELLGLTREEAIERIIKDLQPCDFVKKDCNKSPGHTAPVWVFKKDLSYEIFEGHSIVRSYIKLSIEVIGMCTVISFHRDL